MLRRDHVRVGEAGAAVVKTRLVGIDARVVDVTAGVSGVDVPTDVLWE